MIVLDTHAWVWWATNSSKLSKRASESISSEQLILVPAISVWEVAMLVSTDRLGFDRDVSIWVTQALSLSRVQLSPLSPSIAVRSTRLPGEIHLDPADRIVVATSIEYGAPLVTKDKKLRAYKHIRTIW